MFELQNDVVLNHALFSQRAMDSGALALRGTLLHVFEETGDHGVLIYRDGRFSRRITIGVGGESAAAQLNLDLASNDDADRYAVRARGVVSFYAAHGTGRYAIVINHTSGEVSRTVLDSREGLPANDLFAVTLVRPGTYRARNALNQTQMRAVVRMPRQGEQYDPAQPTLIQAGEQGFDPGEAQILAGQSLLFLARTLARFVVELEEAVAAQR